MKKDFSEQQTYNDDLQNQLTNMKEELNRKSKFLMTLRISKEEEISSKTKLQQLVKELEENNKRFKFCC
jgi:hypothetical protein